MYTLASLNITLQERPRGDRIVVLPFVKATSSILIDMEENREKPERGVVLVVGPGAIGPETGRFVAVESKPGELVSFGRYAGQDFEIQGPHGPLRAIIMRDCEVLLAQDADTFDLEIHDGDPRKTHLKGLTCEHCPKADLSAERAKLLEEERARLQQARDIAAQDARAALVDTLMAERVHAPVQTAELLIASRDAVHALRVDEGGRLRILDARDRAVRAEEAAERGAPDPALTRG